VSAIERRVVSVDGVRTLYRLREGEGHPVLFVHGNPTSSADWEPFIAALERPSVALDLPGWGDSERRSTSELDHTMHGLARFVERFRAALGIGEYDLVVHDWGVVGLIGALRCPEQVCRLVVINAVPILPGYRWHWVARYFWRVPVVGELANATTTRAGLKLLSRQATAGRGAMDDEWIDAMWNARTPGTWPQMLQLYRSADPEMLAAAGAGLERVQAQSLVLWGVEDPFIDVRFGREFAARLPHARLVELEDASHWPWVDRPEAVRIVTGFLSSPA
jgi:pimeloyl-ACP methyl ester carboxylesterase